jgi:hypothetical protein
MEKKVLLTAALALLVVAAAAAGFLILADKTPQPTDRVLAPVRRQTDGMFFKTVVVRFPARVLIVLPEIDNDTIKVGVSADWNELNFGVVLQNMTVKKFLTINNTDVNMKSCVLSYGSIGPLIKVPENNFIIKTGEAKDVLLEFSGPDLGNYTGEVDMITKKPKYGFLEPLLPWVAC